MNLLTLLAFLGPFTVMAFIDNKCVQKYGYPSLSVLITKCYYSKKYKWLAFNIFGDNSWYYESVAKRMDEKNERR